MASEWYISFHGGDASGNLNNIHVFSTDGDFLRKALNKATLSPGLELRELRGFAFGPDGNLYVANSYQDYSQILCFAGTPDEHQQHKFLNVFVQFDATSNPGLKHPFNVVFNKAGDLHVTAQDTNVTVRYHGPHSTSGSPGKPMPLPNALSAHAHQLAPGTLCPSAAIMPDGLQIVREAIFTNSSLYVADRDADSIRKYDPATGAFLGKIKAKGLIDKPIHLLAGDGCVYVGNRGNESIVKIDCATENVTEFIPAKTGGLKDPAGFSFGDDGYFYVASRGTRQILRYDPHLQPDKRPFIDKLSDYPEFIQLVSRR